MGRTFRQFLKIYGPLALGLIVLGSWFLHSRNQGHVLVAEEREHAVVGQVSRFVTDELTSRASDVQFLARLVSRHISEKGIAQLPELEDAFSDFSRSRRDYFILRYLDEMGMERVRVDRSFSGPVISPAEALQFKGGRYYFKESLRAGKNDVYISNFDLNIEHGRIEIPYRPTLRFGCPVYDRTGHKRGVVILNFDGRTMLDRIKLMADGGESGIMLTNGKGYWMLGLTPDDEWGHLLEESETNSMGKRFPEAWGIISSNEKAQTLTDRGLFTFATIDIIPGAVLSDVPSSPEEVKRRWKVVSWVSSAQLKVPWKTLFIVTLSMVLGLLAMGSWQLADNKVHQLEFETQLRDNEERTLAISQASRDAIAMIDSQGRLTHWNPAAENMLGYKEAEVLGQDLHELIAAPDLRERAQEGLKYFAPTGEGPVVGKILEFVATHKNGSEVPIELAASGFQFKGEWYAVGSMRDTSRRLDREIELKRSEETSRALINAPADSAMLVEPNGIIVAINEIGARRLGGTPDSLVGQNAYNLIASGFSETHLGLISKVREEGVPVSFEDTRGDRRILINIYLVQLEGGGVERLAIFTRDVTEQRAAEVALVRSEQRFRDVSEAVSDIIWETDSKGVLTHLTEDVSLVLGYSVNELVGTIPSELVPEEDRQDLFNWLDDTVGRLRPFANVDLQAVTKGGRLVWLEVSGRPYYDSEGKFLGYRGAAMDITDRKATENAIKASERKLRALAESAYDAIVMIDADGVVSFWNDAAEQLFGYAESEALGGNIHQLIAPHEEKEKVDEAMSSFARVGEGPSIGAVTELSVMHKDGTLFPVERSISSFRLGD